MSTITKAAADVLAERQRQISAEGWTPEHDDEHREGELSLAAAGYARAASDQIECIVKGFDDSTNADHICPPGPTDPWPYGWEFRACTPRRALVKAGALILAEIERLDRAAGVTGQILVIATLLERALGVVKNVEAEGCDEGQQLQQLIADGEAAIAAVLQQHAMPQTVAVSADPPDHHPV